MATKKINAALVLLIILFPSYCWSGKKLTAPEGRRVVQALKDALDKGSTTSCRKEQKSVIPVELWEQIVANLEAEKPKKGWGKKKDPTIQLTSRDKLPEGGKNGTFTFYGEGMKFMNLGVPTKIRLRARFYLNVFERGKVDNEETTDIVRSPITKDVAYLEIKVRNPSPSELNSVNKFRVVIKDEDLLSLFNANAENDEEFSALIKKLVVNTKALPQNKDQEKMIESLFKNIYFLARKNPAFIRPVLGVSYERRGYSYTEKKYPLSKAEKKEFGGEDVEYQLTVDANVRGYLPKVQEFKKDFSFDRYFQESSKDIFGHYPLNARVIEFKDPQPMSNFPLKKMSTVHQYLYKELVHKMHAPENIIKGFVKDKGKASHFRTFFKNNPAVESNIVVNEAGEGVLAGEFYSSAKVLLSLQGGDSIVFAKKVTGKDLGADTGKLELLGGRLDKGENAYNALLREVKEEDASGELAKELAKVAESSEGLTSKTVPFPFELQKIFLMEISPSTLEIMKSKSGANSENSGYEVISKKDLAKEVEANPGRFTRKTVKILHKLGLI